MDEAAAIPITGGCVVRPARAVLTAASDALPAGRQFPLSGYRAPRSGGLPQPAGQRGPPQFPSSPSERSEPSTPGSSSRLRSRVFTASVSLRPEGRARLQRGTGCRGELCMIPLPRAHSPRGRLRLTLRTARSIPLEGLSTLGFDQKPGARRPTPVQRDGAGSCHRRRGGHRGGDRGGRQPAAVCHQVRARTWSHTAPRLPSATTAEATDREVVTSR